MQFIDEAKISLTSGSGGNGCISFRREKYEPMGGPNGGNGGAGGSIIIRSNNNINTLLNFRYKTYFEAESGDNGKGNNKTGKAGENLVLDVPVGTQIYSIDNEILLYDFIENNQEFKIVTGGRGGLGNSVFKSSVRQAPEICTEGGEGETIWVLIKLKLLSDVGLLGLPNAGKSTFLSKVTAAKPKIADYPFTTLKPMLGIANIEYEELVIADIPGLIENAHLGSGLGDKFLKHLERCNILIHLIDGSTNDIIRDYLTIRHELEMHSSYLHKKYEIVCLNKIDLLDEELIQHQIAALRTVFFSEIYQISTYQSKGLNPILYKALEVIKNSNPQIDD